MIPLDLQPLRDIRPFVYLATPYSKYPGGIEAAFQEACKCAGWLIRQGVKVYSPIAHTHPIAIACGLDPHDHKIWLPADEPFMASAGAIVVARMGSWQESYGVGQEIAYFIQARKPVFYLYWPRRKDGSE